jgi:hypothetical protein
MLLGFRVVGVLWYTALTEESEREDEGEGIWVTEDLLNNT